MDSVFVRLRKAREAKTLSLDDIASSTNINISFLRSLDEGKSDILPQVYVRAFLREYATLVDLNPDEIIAEYEEQTQRESHKEKSVVSPPPEPEPTDLVDRSATSLPGPKLIATIGVGIILVGVLYWNFSRPSPVETRPETPSVPVSPQPTPATSLQTQEPQPVQEADSILLKATTNDTVWVLIVIDGRDSLEYIFRPNVTASWTAGNMFSVSIGRPDAVEFTLNGEPMGALGTRRRIVRDSLITRQTLARLKER